MSQVEGLNGQEAPESQTEGPKKGNTTVVVETSPIEGETRNKKGQWLPGVRGAEGRAKGTPNRIPEAVRIMVHKALEEAGGWRYLLEQAEKNPRAFLALVGRILPQTPKVEIGSGARVLVVAGGQVPELEPGEQAVIDVTPSATTTKGREKAIGTGDGPGDPS